MVALVVLVQLLAGAGPPEDAEPLTAASQPLTPRCNAEAERAITRGRSLRSPIAGKRPGLTAWTAAHAADPRCARAAFGVALARLAAGDVDGAFAAWDELGALVPALPAGDRGRYTFLLRKGRLQTWRLLRAAPPPAPAAQAPAPTGTGPRAAPTLRIAAVGDVHLGRGDDGVVPPDDGRGSFDDAGGALKAADIGFGNLETALADEGESKKCASLDEDVCAAFRAPTRLAPALKAAGLDVVSVENNHALDFGFAGLASTVAALDDAGIAAAGAARAVRLVRRGLRVSVVGFSTYASSLSVRDPRLAARVVAWLKARSDVVVVAFHAGAEGPSARHVPPAAGEEVFHGEPRGDVVTFAHAVVDAGADLVLGSGPHVLRALEVRRGRLIAYSLGNACSWKTFDVHGPDGESVVLDATVAADGRLVGLVLHPIYLDGRGVPHADDGAAAVATIRALSFADFGDPVVDEAGRLLPFAGRPVPGIAAVRR